ncbi:MAG: ribosome-associated translation inhibitor RaiA [bacterium]
MEIRITGRHVQVTNAMKDYVEKKLSHLEKYFNHIIEAHVIMDIEKKNRHRIEVVLHTNIGKIFGEEETEDMYASIDKVLEKMEVQLKRQKEKIQKHKLKKDIKQAEL